MKNTNYADPQTQDQDFKRKREQLDKQVNEANGGNEKTGTTNPAANIGAYQQKGNEDRKVVNREEQNNPVNPQTKEQQQKQQAGNEQTDSMNRKDDKQTNQGSDKKENDKDQLQKKMNNNEPDTSNPSLETDDSDKTVKKVPNMNA